MTRRWFPLLLAVAVCSPAWATDHPQDALKLILKQNIYTGKAKAVWVSKNPPLVLPASPPTSVGGAFVVTGVDQTGTATLGTGNWKTNAAGTLYKYVNKEAPGGDSLCKIALVKDANVLKVVCKDSLIDLDDAAQGTVAASLTIGSDVYCSTCSGALKDEGGPTGGKFIGKGCANRPTDCGVAPTTTTTTLPQAVCGNGVIEYPEQCDGESYCPGCFIPRYACCEFGSGDSTCAKAVPAMVLLAYQYQVCGIFGGTFMTGLVPSGTEACPDPSQGTLGPCGGPAPAFPTPVSVCCQATATTCLANAVADGTEYSLWYRNDCAYPHYDTVRGVVLGTCGEDGECVPAH
jgi:hypothetical protein